MPSIRRRGSGATVDRQLLRLMGVLLLGAVAALLDTTVVSVALGDLTREFGATVASVQWVTTSYLLAMAAVIPLMGWLTDRWGPRRVWLGTLWLFLIGSALCSIAWSIESLVAFRVIQGLGGGLILPLVQAILAREAGPARIGRVMGLVGIPGQLVPILGPVAGGLLVGGLGWRWIFLVNVPVGLVALALAHRHLDDHGRRRAVRLDIRGLLLLVAATVAILGGLSLTTTELPGRWVAITIAAFGLALLVVFVVHTQHLNRGALLALDLLRFRSFSVSALMMFLFGICLYGPMLLLPLYFQQVRGLGVTEVGLLLAPQGVGTMLALWTAGRWTDSIGPRPVALMGTVLSGVGTLTFAIAEAATPTVALSAGLVLMGAGLGTTGVAVSAAGYRQVEPDRIAHATSLLNVVQRFGAAFGTTAIALILQRRTGLDPAAPAVAFAHTFWWAFAFTAATFATALLLPARSPTADTRSLEEKGPRP